MEAMFLVVHLMVALAIIIIVLIQPAESGGFVGGGNMSNMSPRKGANTLTRVTTILAGIFFVTSLSLAIIAEHRAPAKSILDVVAAESAAEMPDTKKLKDVKKSKKTKKEKPVAPISK